MENLIETTYSQRKRISARQAQGGRKRRAFSNCPCCRDDQTAAVRRPKKRKRISASPKPSLPTPQLPVTPSVAPGPQPLKDDVFQIHNHSVEQYQQLYHHVVDDMLKFRTGRPRPYSLDLGRRVKQRLWETMRRPLISTTVCEDGRVEVTMTYDNGIYAPFHNVDISNEPESRMKNKSSTN